MKCIILAAGYATRLYPLTKNFPKPLLEVKDKAILDWLIDDIADIIDEFIVVSNHKFYPFFVEWASKRNEKIVIVDDGTETVETRLGAVGDIKYAIDKLGIEDDCIVMAGDNLLDFSLKDFALYVKKCGTSSVMCHPEKRLAALQKTAVITIDENSVITSYEEKPKEPKGNLAVPPFYYYKYEDLKRIDEALNEGCNIDAPGSYAAWLSSKTEMHAYIMPGKRYDIGDIESLNNVRNIFAG